MIIYAFFVSVSAFACPTFNAKYNCAYGDGSRSFDLKSRVAGGTTIYNYNGMDIIADGQERPYSVDRTLKASCLGETLSLSFIQANNSGVLCNGVVAKQLGYGVNWIKSGKKILEHNTGTIICADGTQVPAGIGDYVCTEV